MKVLKASKQKLSKEMFITTNMDGIICGITENCQNLLGYTQEEMSNNKLDSYFVNHLDLDSFLKKKDLEDVILKLKHKDGNTVYMEVSWETIQGSDVNDRLLFRCIDVTKSKENKEQHVEILNILEKSKDIVYSLYTKPEFTFNYLNSAVYNVLGYTSDDQKNNPSLLYDIAHPDDVERHRGVILGDADYSQAIAIRFRHKEGHYIWFENFVNPTFDEYGELVKIEGIARNIHERKELEERLTYLSYHDILTGYYNRRYFEKCKERLNENQDKAVGLILCDLDNLKLTNDTLGHDAGDVLLKIASELIQASIGENSLIARIGGDEFIVVLEDFNYEAVKNTVTRIKESIQNHNKHNADFPVQISIGFGYSNRSKGFMEEIFRDADKSMYENKQYRKA